MKTEQISSLAGNRRTFLKGAGLTGIGLAGAAMIGKQFGSNEQKVEAASVSDVDVLNFALNLEYLEAEFYAVATYGATLVQLGVISSMDQTGPTTGGKMVPGFAKLPEAFLASALRIDEIKHVVFLRSALGSSAVKKPAINLNALGYGFANVNDWLKLARQFEDVGVSAYLGAAPLISTSPYLGAAAAILATEAQHAGSIRDVCIKSGGGFSRRSSNCEPTVQRGCSCFEHSPHDLSGVEYCLRWWPLVRRFLSRRDEWRNSHSVNGSAGGGLSSPASPLPISRRPAVMD